MKQNRNFPRMILIFLILSVIFFGECSEKSFDTNKYLDYCVTQAKKSVDNMPLTGKEPRSIDSNETHWNMVPVNDWTSGFWPGILWNLYEYTGNKKWENKADTFTRFLTPIAYQKAHDHDLGFMIFCSFGNGYRLTKNEEYKKVILAASDSLATLFNPRVGTILSWPFFKDNGHKVFNTIIDNMMNLELLFWASKNGPDTSLYNIAETHAMTTLNNQIRPDFTSYHVIEYDSITGKKIKGVTAQGFGNETMWARGQAWGIYGFTMAYRETGNEKFLHLAQKMADVFISRLPADDVPYWDFDAPDIPDAPKDASAAAIAASAFLELSVLSQESNLKKYYRNSAVKILKSLSGSYLSRDKNSAFLLHCTGNKPRNSEIDVSLIYADYYYLEALLRLKKIQEGISIYDNLRHI